MQKDDRITVGWTAFFVTDLQRVDEDCFHQFLAAYIVRITGPLAQRNPRGSWYPLNGDGDRPGRLQVRIAGAQAG